MLHDSRDICLGCPVENQSDGFVAGFIIRTAEALVLHGVWLAELILFDRINLECQALRSREEVIYVSPLSPDHVLCSRQGGLRT